MVTWRKTLEVTIRYLKRNDRKNKNNNLVIEYVTRDDRISNPMKICIPETNDHIIVDAEAMKTACDKIIAIGRI